MARSSVIWTILREAVAAHGGVLFKVVGDATQSAFATAPEAVAAAVAGSAGAARRSRGQMRLGRAARCGWRSTPARPRRRDGDYLAAPLNRLSRLLAAGSRWADPADGGCRAAGRRQCCRPASSLRALGTHRLRDLQEPEEVFQVVAPGLPDTFPALRGLPRHPTNLTTPPTPHRPGGGSRGGPAPARLRRARGW